MPPRRSSSAGYAALQRPKCLRMKDLSPIGARRPVWSPPGVKVLDYPGRRVTSRRPWRTRS